MMIGDLTIKDLISDGMTAITAIATITIAIYVARISRRQWWTSKEKLRLDLYERRFDVYMRILDFYQALLAWEATPAQKQLQFPFIKAHLESRFLFPESSGVHEHLNDFHHHSFKIVNFDQLKPLAAADPKEFMKYANERQVSAAWILDSMSVLEKKLAPYLNFHDI